MRSLAILLLAAPLAIAGPLNPFNLLPRAPIYGCADDESWIGSGCVKQSEHDCPPGQCKGSQGCTKLGCRPEDINDKCPAGQVLAVDGCIMEGAGSGGCPPGQCQGTDGCTAIGCTGLLAVGSAECPPGQCQGTDGCTTIGCNTVVVKV